MYLYQPVVDKCNLWRIARKQTKKSTQLRRRPCRMNHSQEIPQNCLTLLVQRKRCPFCRANSQIGSFVTHYKPRFFCFLCSSHAGRRSPRRCGPAQYETQVARQSLAHVYDWSLKVSPLRPFRQLPEPMAVFEWGPLIPGQYRLSLQLSSSTGSPVSGKLTGLQSAGDPSDANVIQSAASDLTWRRVGQDDFVEARLREPFQSRVLSLARASQWGCLNHCLLRASIRRAHSIHNHCKKYERSLCLWNRTLCRSWVSCPTRQAHNSHGISRTAMMRPPSQLHEFANWTSFCNQVKHPCFLLSQLRSVHLSSYVKRQKRRTRLNSFA
jgi:hypothetical protein